MELTTELGDASGTGRLREARALELVGMLWVLIATVVFLWQAVTYRGLVALLAELQFDWTGRYYPTLTCALLIGFSTIPGFFLLRVATRRRLAEAAPVPRRGGEIFRALTGVAAGFLITAVGAVILTIRLPSDQGPPRLVRTDKAPPTDLADGPAILVGHIDYLRPAALKEDVWLSRRDTLVAPMGAMVPPAIAPAGRSTSPGTAAAAMANAPVGFAKDPPIRFFAQLDPGQHADPAHQIETRRGLLKRNALPGELVRLYRYAGLPVSDPYWVLYDDRKTLRWPYLLVAVELAIVALVLLLAAVVLRLLDRQIE